MKPLTSQAHDSAMSRKRSIAPLAASILALALTACGNGFRASTATAAAPAVPPSIWVGAWGASMANANTEAQNKGGTSTTYRFLIYPTLGGTQERLHFSNYFGTSPLTIASSRLSIGKDGSPAIDAANDLPLTFNGQPSVTLAPGQVVTSDPVNLTFTYGQTLAVSMFLSGSFGQVDRHSALFITNYRTEYGAGDQTTNVDGTKFTENLGDWHIVSELDVYGQYQGTVALFGSSTTDGNHSDYSSNQVYPDQNQPVANQHASRLSDQLARRLHAAGYQVGVINAGIGGDTVTDDISNQINGVQSANQRIARDVLALPNLLSMVTYFGSIDIRSQDCRSAPDIEAATTQMIATAHAAGVPLFLATIPPSAFCTTPGQANYGPYPMPPIASDPYAGGANPGPQNGGETQRLDFNAWIRSTGVTLPGVRSILDFDQVLADPSRLNFMLPLYNSGDNYHPNGAGYGAEAGIIPLSTLVSGH